MIKKFYFLTTLLSIATSRQCHAMKNNLLVNNNDVPIQQATILAKITAVEKPCTALYLTEDHVFIGDGKKYSVVDIRTNQEIKKISEDCSGLHISLHPNLKKFAFCSGHDPHNLIIYDTITYNTECIITCDGYISSSYFSPLDTTIALNQINNPEITLYNYKTNKITRIEANPENLNNYIPRPVISFHPTKQLMYLAWKNIYSLNLNTSKTKKLTTEEMDHYGFCRCSPDGLFIIAGTKKKITLTSLDTFSSRTLIDESSTPNSSLTNMAIHPNSKILTTLSKSMPISKILYSLRYWNINRSELISTMDIPCNPDTCESPSFSISPNGKTLLLVINEECMEIAIPFEARYKDLTKETGVFTCFALQHYLHNGTDQLSADIRNLLITALLKASEY